MSENVVESGPPSAKRPKLSSLELSVSASDGTGEPNQGPSTQSTAGMMPTVNSPVNQPGLGMHAGINAGMNPGILPAGNGQGMTQGQVVTSSSEAGRGCSNPEMGGQVSLSGPQPGAMNKDCDLGIAHNNTENQEHKTEKPGLGIGDESNNQQAAATQTPADSRHLQIQSCIQSLTHACQCRSASCSVPSCQKMKTVIQHTKGCKRKTSGGCPVCKQLIALCCYHAKHCQENKCPVPFCLNIRCKLRQQQLQHHL